MLSKFSFIITDAVATVMIQHLCQAVLRHPDWELGVHWEKEQKDKSSAYGVSQPKTMLRNGQYV